MPSWASAFFTDGFGQGLMWAWNFCMSLFYDLLTYSFKFEPNTVEIPEVLEKIGIGDAVSAVLSPTYTAFNEIYSIFSAIGILLINLFCLIAFCRQASNLKEKVTIEMWIELFIKALIGNMVILNGASIARSFLSIAVGETTNILQNSTLNLVAIDNIDVGAVLMYILIGLIFVIGSVVCGIMIVATVLKRIFTVYFLICMMPIAGSALAGGRELEHHGWAWLKTFLTECFSIVVMAIVVRMGGAIYTGLQITIRLNASGNYASGWFDGGAEVLLAMIYMVFLTTAIKGSGELLKRTFDLR